MPSPKSNSTQDIVVKLWHLCNILRESGITYPEYVTELTYLLFLRMAGETGSEKALPKGYRWQDLASRTGAEQFAFYKKLLHDLPKSTTGHIRDIFEGAETCLNNPDHLTLLVAELAQIDWYATREENTLADLYEGLLEKNSTESKAGAGQYFTPRLLIEAIIEVIKPQPGELIQDPACGTAGFLIAADRYIKAQTDQLKKLAPAMATFQRQKAFVGIELVPQTHKLALMNAMLHGIRSPITNGDTLAEAGEKLTPADLILTNPPFGTKRGAGLPKRKLPFPTSNKQLAFLQHIYLGLKPGGRAAVVMPDLKGAAAPKICADLMAKCRLHTVLRLPSGIFYAPGVKTNVLFFSRGETDENNTSDVWIYDMRANMPRFGKRTPLTVDHFRDFVAAYGSKSDGSSPRTDLGIKGRFRCFRREEIRKNGESFDIGWLRENSVESGNVTESPDAIMDRIVAKLGAAMRDLQRFHQSTAKK